MSLRLIVAEKPSVARSIARVLGANTRGEGFLRGETDVVTWALGHLVALSDPDEIDPALKKWRRDTLPILPPDIPLKVVPKTRAQFNVIKKWMGSREVDRIVCATDSGREGELIFRYIYRAAGCQKPVQRLWIHSLTDEAIRRGFEDLKPGESYDNLYKSALCRSQSDWLVGMNASRAYTLRHNALLSIGRVQTPTLAMLVARRREIEAFDPRDFWTLTANFGDYTGQWFDPDSQQDRFYEEGAAKEVAARVKGKEGVVESSDWREERIPPPLLYDLTALQRDMNRQAGFSAKKTLEIAQSLYEKHKALTYPRTDCRYVSKDLLPDMKKALAGVSHPELAPIARELAARPQLPVTKRLVNDAEVTEHHAIIPTPKSVNLAALDAGEAAVYETVLRRFIAAFLPHRREQRGEIITRVEEDFFRSRGMALLEAGWSALYPPGKETPLPRITPGETRKVAGTSVKKSVTKPPAHHTEGTLLSAMEQAGRQVEEEELRRQLKDRGLGTPATRAATIERLIAVGYVQRRGKNLVATDKGMALIGILPEPMTSPATTGRWEAGLAKIGRGEMAPQRFMESIGRYVHYIIQSADASQPGSIPRDPPRRPPAKRTAPRGKGPGKGTGKPGAKIPAP